VVLILRSHHHKEKRTVNRAPTRQKIPAPLKRTFPSRGESSSTSSMYYYFENSHKKRFKKTENVYVDHEMGENEASHLRVARLAEHISTLSAAKLASHL